RALEGATPTDEMIKRIREALTADAICEGPECEVYIRVAEDAGIIYLDLCDDDWRVVEISAGDGWKVIDEAPVRLGRAPTVQALPEPDTGGDINALRRYTNVASDIDFILIVAWLLAGLRPRGPYPVLGLHGEHGSAKSTLTKVLRALIDPSSLPTRRPP